MNSSGVRALATFAAFLVLVTFILLAVFLPTRKQKGSGAGRVARSGPGCPAECQCTQDYAPGTKYDLVYENLSGTDNKTTCTFTKDGFRFACPVGCCSPRCV